MKPPQPRPWIRLCLQLSTRFIHEKNYIASCPGNSPQIDSQYVRYQTRTQSFHLSALGYMGRI